MPGVGTAGSAGALGFVPSGQWEQRAHRAQGSKSVPQTNTRHGLILHPCDFPGDFRRLRGSGAGAGHAPDRAGWDPEVLPSVLALHPFLAPVTPKLLETTWEAGTGSRGLLSPPVPNAIADSCPPQALLRKSVATVLTLLATSSPCALLQHPQCPTLGSHQAERAGVSCPSLLRVRSTEAQRHTVSWHGAGRSHSISGSAAVTGKLLPAEPAWLWRLAKGISAGIDGFQWAGLIGGSSSAGAIL